ncbi:MAG: hypothetical protein ACK6DW_12425 [Betaproteobacteria bacterium]|jgi:hypothetical protein
MLLGSALEEKGIIRRLHYTCDFSNFLKVLQAAGDRCQPATSRLRAWLSTQVQA